MDDLKIIRVMNIKISVMKMKEDLANLPEKIFEMKTLGDFRKITEIFDNVAYTSHLVLADLEDQGIEDAEVIFK